MIHSVTFTYPINTPKDYTYKSTMKYAGILEVLDTYVRDSMGAGEDYSEANKRDVYTITIQIDVTDDRLIVSSDTGNKGLTLGILIDIMGMMQ